MSIYSNFISYISNKITINLFKQRLPIRYILFNYLYKKFVINSSINNDEIFQFHKSGFVKLNLNFEKEINIFKNKFYFKDEINKKKRNYFSMKQSDEKEFIKAIFKKLRPTITLLEEYFNCDIIVPSIMPFRIHDIKDIEKIKGEEFYSENFHQDGYIMIYNKIFINMMDIRNEDGPLEVIPLENRKSFFNDFNYKDRHNYKSNGNQNLIFRNTGKIGDCTLLSSPQVIHRAGIPKNFRDVIQIILLAVPKKFSNKYNLSNTDNITGHPPGIKKISKPSTYLELISFFYEILKIKKVRIN